jgi:cell division protein FtsZ
VVATGMDGASIAAIEPAPRRISARQAAAEAIAEPVYAEPVAVAAPEPEPAYEEEIVLEEIEPVIAQVAAEPAAAPQVAPPKIFEPLRAAAYTPQVAPTPIQAPAAIQAPAPVAAEPDPVVVEAPVRTVARIVDPSVADEEELEPLFANTPHYADDRRQKSGGWLSLFGRPRHDQTHAPTASGGGAQPALQLAHEEPVEDADDLEIPSFLRRLAN